MIPNDDYIFLSAINQYSYCPRRCFLIHCEGIFEDNVFTIEGSLLHKRVDSGVQSTRDGAIEHRRIHLVSHKLKIRGIADLIEETDGVFCPVEYKRGKRGKWENNELQVCAQAMCLEEMLSLPPIQQGAIFYAQSGRRQTVDLTNELRSKTVQTIEEIRQMIEMKIDPNSTWSIKCEDCSLHRVCLPKETGWLKKLSLEKILQEAEK